MAYNLQSLITILEQILNPDQTHWILDHNKLQLESLLEKAASLQQMLEKPSLAKIESLESQIRDAAHEAEDLIESHMADQMLSNPEGESFNFFTPDFQQVMQELDMVMEEAVKLAEGKTVSTTSSSTSGASFSSHGSVVVGVDADLKELKGRLAGMESKLEIIPIIGMGGVGKTTLARKLYEDPFVVEHFDTLAWTTISQDYNLKAILVCLLRCIIGKEEFDNDQHNDDLKHILYQSLFEKRYKIVLDDMWNTEFWDDIWKIFPDNDNGSRIVITTRESDVGRYAGAQSLLHQVQLLSEFESWNLLRQIVFGEEDCPSALQEIGETIASNCGGLPLAINVIGGLLSDLEKSKDVWENISTDVRAAIAESDDQFPNILSLSYNHLPNHLKPCFLYMGAFPEDYRVKTSRLIHLWVAEGFIKENGDKSLEEEAEDYLKSLVERNLLSVGKKMYDGKPFTIGIHDLLRDLCMRKAEDEKFLRVKNGPESPFSRGRRVSVETVDGMEDVYASVEPMLLVRTFLIPKIKSRGNELRPPFLLQLRLVRVLDVIKMKFKEFPTELLQLFNLRYLAISCYAAGFTSAISRLWNLQTLIVKGFFILDDLNLSSEMWEMSELRHLKCSSRIYFNDDSIVKFVQKTLQTISSVHVTHSLIKMGFFQSIPNIKELDIFYGDEELPSSAVDLSHLHKLETISCERGLNEEAYFFVHTLRFPSSLKNVALEGFVLLPSDLTALSALPNLEVLTLSEIHFVSEDGEEIDEEWTVPDGDVFRSLQVLNLKLLVVKRWRADENNFPKLRYLNLRRCRDLEEIPSGIGDIATLQLIEIKYCNNSVGASAEEIQKVQQSDYENYGLQLSICFSSIKCFCIFRCRFCFYFGTVSNTDMQVDDLCELHLHYRLHSSLPLCFLIFVWIDYLLYNTTVISQEIK